MKIFLIKLIFLIGVGKTFAYESLTSRNSFYDTPQSMSPFKHIQHDAIRLSPAWTMNGSNWRRHVWKTYDEMASSTTIRNKQAASQNSSHESEEVLHLPPAGRFSFSTCLDTEATPSRNWLRSPLVDSLPSQRPPFVLVVEFSIHVAETCLRANRPHCRSGIDLWLIEAVSSHNRTHFDRRLIYNGSAVKSNESNFKYDGRVPKTNRLISVSFRVNRMPFKLEFRDVRGACLEIRGARLEVLNCLITQPAGRLFMTKSKSFAMDQLNETTAETTLPLTTTATSTRSFNESDRLKSGSKEQLLSDLKCMCPAGFRMSEDGDMCLGCPVDTFTDKPHDSKVCTPCPSRSVAPFALSTTCSCSESTFRVPGEGPHTPCTAPPTAPASMKVTYLDTHSAAINWTQPRETGNRSDLTFHVQCVAGCRDVILTRAWNAFGADQSVIISLEDSWKVPKRAITIRIYSLNGVSVVAGPAFAKYVEAIIRLPRALNETDGNGANESASAADENFFSVILSTVGILGIIGIGVGCLVLCCLVFCLVRYSQDSGHGDRREVKILGAPPSNNSSRRGSQQSSDEMVNNRTAELILKLPNGHDNVDPLLVRQEMLPAPVFNMTITSRSVINGVNSPNHVTLPLLAASGDDASTEDFQSFISSEATGDSSSLYSTPPASRRTQKPQFILPGYHSNLPPVKEH